MRLLYAIYLWRNNMITFVEQVIIRAASTQNYRAPYENNLRHSLLDGLLDSDVETVWSNYGRTVR